MIVHLKLHVPSEATVRCNDHIMEQSATLPPPYWGGKWGEMGKWRKWKWGLKWGQPERNDFFPRAMPPPGSVAYS